MTKLESIVENLLNGNLRDAKRLARPIAHWRIKHALREFGGHSEGKAALGADFLKGRDCWEIYCQAE